MPISCDFVDRSCSGKDITKSNQGTTNDAGLFVLISAPALRRRAKKKGFAKKVDPQRRRPVYAGNADVSSASVRLRYSQYHKNSFFAGRAQCGRDVRVPSNELIDFLGKAKKSASPSLTSSERRSSIGHPS